jgi:hypothetical protein
MPHVESSNHSPRCENCEYIMPSYSSKTGFRCGLQYFKLSALLRKLKRMDHYPEIKLDNACEAWQEKQTD